MSLTASGLASCILCLPCRRSGICSQHRAFSDSFKSLCVHQRPIPNCRGILSFRRSTWIITRASSFPSNELLSSYLTNLVFVSQSCTFWAKTASASLSRVIPSNMKDTSLPINLYELFLYSTSRINVGVYWIGVQGRTNFFELLSEEFYFVKRSSTLLECWHHFGTEYSCISGKCHAIWTMYLVVVGQSLSYVLFSVFSFSFARVLLFRFFFCFSWKRETTHSLTLLSCWATVCFHSSINLRLPRTDCQKSS